MIARVLAIALVACGAQPVTPRPALRLASCHVPSVAEPLLCGMLDVPEDRAHPGARRLQLPVVVLPARAGLGRGIPIFDVAGGPGIASTAAAALYANELPQLREVGDIVLVDQRGTGDGPASLRCPELDDAPQTVTPDLAVVQRCQAALAARADLRFYGTADLVRDLDDARRALGYDRVTLEALSYGTRVVQTYMRMFPAHVHSVVLYGTLAMDVHLPGDFAPAAQHGLDQILDDCTSDRTCAAAFPHVRDDLAAAAHAALPAGTDRTAFSEWVRHRIATAQGARALPSALAHFAAGDFSPFLVAEQGPPLREALLLSVTCSEDIPAIDRGAAQSAQATWFGDGRLVWQLAACATWPRHAVAPGTFDPVASDAPVLVFAGERDSITPPDYARRAIARMPHARLVEVPWLGHMPDGITHLECLEALEYAFLRDPNAPLDTRCIATIEPPPFAR